MRATMGLVAAAVVAAAAADPAADPAADATLETYPAPTPTFPAGPFGVAVSPLQGEAAARDSFVYVTQQGGRAQSWTTFSFEGGAATVAVTPA